MQVTYCDFCGDTINESYGPVRFNCNDIELCEKCWRHLWKFINVKGNIPLMEGGEVSKESDNGNG